MYLFLSLFYCYPLPIFFMCLESFIVFIKYALYFEAIAVVLKPPIFACILAELS